MCNHTTNRLWSQGNNGLCAAFSHISALVAGHTIAEIKVACYQASSQFGKPSNEVQLPPLASAIYRGMVLFPAPLRVIGNWVRFYGRLL